jgi:hypothetical protein
MSNRLLVNGSLLPLQSLSPEPAQSAFFVNVFESASGRWMGVLPAPSPRAIPLSLLALSSDQSYMQVPLCSSARSISSSAAAPFYSLIN